MKYNRHFLTFIMIGVTLILTLGLSTGLAQVTSPEEHFGFKPGADFKLLTYEQAIGYFELIAGQTDRMQIFDMGPTSQGRRMKYAVISSAENLRQLNRYKDINRRLTLVRELNDREARRLAEQGKAIVWIDGGLHASECAPTQLLPILAYDLITGRTARMENIRDNVVTLIVFANPDGMTIVSDWYMKNVGTPYEVSSVPWLYHKYAGHDNNRDSFMGNLVETQNMNQATSQEWFPTILYNQHQTGPFPARIWIPPDSEPTNPNVHPLIIRWKNLIGSAMGKSFDQNNQPGAISRVKYDSWYPGYATQVAEGRNTISILTETQLYKYATPKYFSTGDFPAEHRDLTVGVFYPTPWQGGWWRLGDAVTYNHTACLSILDVAAKYRDEFLYDKYRMGKDTIERFENEPPYGWIIPPDQTDQNTTALMLNRLMLNGVEIYTADEEFYHDGITYPQGSYLLSTSQPFGLFLKNMFEKQDYPDLRRYSHLWQGLVSMETWQGGPLRPYDGVGWTLPLQLGVRYKEISRPLDVDKTLITQAQAPAGTFTGRGGKYIFTHSDNNSFKALYRILQEGGKVSWANESFTLGETEYPSGTFMVEADSISSRLLQRIASDTRISMQAGNVSVESTPLRRPRIALYKSWTASMDAGWITYIFDQFGYEYHSLVNAEVKTGNLRDRFDVIVLADQGASQIIDGHKKGTIPPDYAGGIGPEGVENLKTFVEQGGTLICNKASCGLAVTTFNLPIKNVLQGVSSDEFNCPGSILKLDFDTEHPLAFGMPQRGVAYFSGAQVFEIENGAGEKEQTSTKAIVETREKQPEKAPAKPLPKIVARYPDEPLLLSGWMIGDDKIRDRPAVLDTPVGKGKVVLFGFNVHNRAQSYTTFKLLFNALYY
ncbi:M14 family metallopeptidase [Planctomycetota bacterium]